MGRIAVSVKPGSKRPGISADGDAFEVRVGARAHEGAANEAVRRALARALGVPVRDVSLARGAAARHKAFDVAGLPDDEIRTRFSTASAAAASVPGASEPGG